MTYYERIDELRANTHLDADNLLTTYLEAQTTLANLLSEQLMGAEITSSKYGIGKVTEVVGHDLENLIMVVAFACYTKKFAVLPVITDKVPLVKFSDISEIGDAWDEAYNLYVDWSRQRLELNRTAYRQNLEAKKQAEADKKAESAYNRTKDRMIKEFERQTNKTREAADTEAFYYALGWLTKHVGSIYARLPDYLSESFKRHFGNDVTFHAVDSKKRTVNGNSTQWTFGFTATLHNSESIPATLSEHLSSAGNKIADTSFIWDLVENYGFQFGKKQDIEKIRACVPFGYLASFEAGLA